VHHDVKHANHSLGIEMKFQSAGSGAYGESSAYSSREEV
jgi:hypothetical protein